MAAYNSISQMNWCESDLEEQMTLLKQTMNLYLGMVVCNTFFKNEDSKLINYQSGDNRSMIDYLMVRKTDRCQVKVISSEECVPQHRMVIGRLRIPMKPQKKKIVKFEPKPRVWKLIKLMTSKRSGY